MDFYVDGLTGSENSAKKRDELAEKFGLPDGMSPNALLGALNMLASKEEFLAMCEEIFVL